MLVSQRAVVGAVYGRLTVVREAMLCGNLRKVRCRCSCGTVLDVSVYNVLSGNTKSCGCYKLDRVTKGPNIAWREGSVYRIELTRRSGDVEYTFVSAQDYPLVQPYRWFVVQQGRCKYAAANRKRGDCVPMHRMLMRESLTLLLEVDHRDGDGLNNRRNNLRMATRLENTRNTTCSWSNTGYKGVHKNARGRYVARIGLESKQIHIGVFSKARDAAIAYNEQALLLYGDFAALNELDSEKIIFPRVSAISHDSLSER